MTKLAAVCVFVGLAATLLAAPELLPNREPNALSSSADVVSQVAKLLHAGTAPDIVVGFIQQWSQLYLTSADDLRALRNAGATDEVLNAFARRGAELRLRAAVAAGQVGETTARANPPTVLFYPAGQNRPAYLLAEPSRQAPLYPFSDALWWWANVYPYPFDPYPFWGALRPRLSHR